MDYQFCFPLKLNLSHRDYLKPCLLILHLLSLVIVYLTVGATATTIGACACLVSLRYYFSQQETIGRFQMLQGFDLDEWYLTNPTGEVSKVRLISVLMIGPVLMFRLRHHGDPVGWITCAVHQAPQDWHKVRVLDKH